MRHLALVPLLAFFATPASAEKRVTVDKLEQVLAASRHMPDTKLAQEIYELELTERLSEDRLARLEEGLPGPLARQALIAVADASEFLDLPVHDLSARAAPDPSAQSSMLALTADFAHKSISRLPNFYATRETSRFEDTPMAALYTQASDTYQPLHQISRSSATVLYRNGNEVVRAEIAKGAKSKSVVRELSTHGVFGPVLSTVLADAADGTIAWSHWEEGPSGLRAVFNYRVPQRASHYSVVFPSEELELDYPANADLDSLAKNGTRKDARRLPAYHGEIAVNPADGSILRMTIIADMKSSDPVIRADLMVEYGRVVLGGRTYICPLKSVSLSLEHVMYETAILPALGPPQLRVNDEVFKQYHLFRGDVYILTGAEQGPG